MQANVHPLQKTKKIQRNTLKNKKQTIMSGSSYTITFDLTQNFSDIFPP